MSSMPNGPFNGGYGYVTCERGHLRMRAPGASCPQCDAEHRPVARLRRLLRRLDRQGKVIRSPFERQK